MYHDKPRVMYNIAESLCCTPETNTTLYVIWKEKKKM